MLHGSRELYSTEIFALHMLHSLKSSLNHLMLFVRKEKPFWVFVWCAELQSRFRMVRNEMLTVVDMRYLGADYEF